MNLHIEHGESDCSEFNELVAQIICGAIRQCRPSQVYVFRVDNWFDHKWVGFSGGNEASHGDLAASDLRVPPFVPNRILSQEKYRYDAGKGDLDPLEAGPLVHRDQPGNWGALERISKLGDACALFWYSAQSRLNERGSIMAFLPADEVYWSWYVGYKANPWRPSRLVQIDARDLESFARLAT